MMRGVLPCGTLGIIGGGQLGSMIASAALELGLETSLYVQKADEPALRFASRVRAISGAGGYQDKEAIAKFVQECDFVAIETENILPEALDAAFNACTALNKNPPGLAALSRILRIAGNRLREKELFQSLGIQTTKFCVPRVLEHVLQLLDEGPCILKTQGGGYDGRGQLRLQNRLDALEKRDQLGAFLDDIEHFAVPCIAEREVEFLCESSCLVSRSLDGQCVFLPTPVNVHHKGILRRSYVIGAKPNGEYTEMAREAGGLGWPSDAQQNYMRDATKKIAELLEYVGTIAVEFFILKDGGVIANEMACRPHNSGHFSMDLCNVSQFENHVRAVCGLPLRQTRLLHDGFMVNVLGGNIDDIHKNIDNPACQIYLYGKSSLFEERKVGHMNFIGLQGYDAAF